jgi:hypothetical protein
MNSRSPESVRVISDEVLASLTIWMEARGEPLDGQVAVGEIIRRRMQRQYFSNGTIADTVLRPGQFSCWLPGPHLVSAFTVETMDLTYRVARIAWRDSATSELVPEAVHYLNVGQTLRLRGGTLPIWARDANDPREPDPVRVVSRIGQHTFLRA